MRFALGFAGGVAFIGLIALLWLWAMSGPGWWVVGLFWALLIARAYFER